MSQFEPEVPAEETAPVLPVRNMAHTRTKVIFTGVVVLFAVAVGCTYAVASQHPETVVGAPGADALSPKINGVDVGYLPDGLGQPESVPAVAADLSGVALRWRDGDGVRMVQVSVYRSDKISDALDILALNVMRNPGEPSKATDPVVSADRTDMMWVADPGLVLRVTTSESSKGALEAIARGLHVAQATA